MAYAQMNPDQKIIQVYSKAYQKSHKNIHSYHLSVTAHIFLAVNFPANRNLKAELLPPYNLFRKYKVVKAPIPCYDGYS